MKKLNKKGFTLIELLAVIVILAVVLVVTIPSVLNTMATARKKQFENALTVIEDYVQKQYDICSLGNMMGTDDYKETIVTRQADGSCTTATNVNTAVLTETGYDTDIDTVAVSCANNTCRVTAATAKADGKFRGASRTASANNNNG